MSRIFSKHFRNKTHLRDALQVISADVSLLNSLERIKARVQLSSQSARSVSEPARSQRSRFSSQKHRLTLQERFTRTPRPSSDSGKHSPCSHFLFWGKLQPLIVGKVYITYTNKHHFLSFAFLINCFLSAILPFILSFLIVQILLFSFFMFCLFIYLFAFSLSLNVFI